MACCCLDWLALLSNTQELLARGVQVGLKCREPYNPVLEASIGYASAAAVAIIDELTFVNKCQEIGLVAFMFFFELLFSYVSLTIPSMFPFTNLSSIILFLSAD